MYSGRSRKKMIAKANIRIGPIIQFWINESTRILTFRNTSPSSPKKSPTLSHHLDALTRSRLLAARRSGRFIYYAVNWKEAANLIRFLTEDCCADMLVSMGQRKECC
jgi:DNA-binding transcriptional ArsR family regulator